MASIEDSTKILTATSCFIFLVVVISSSLYKIIIRKEETELKNQVYAYNESAYQTQGLGAQRRYPNEELCRFMGRNFFPTLHDQRKKIKILELGCGSGANLWMIAKEGFDAHGIDLSPSAICLAGEMLDLYSQSATFEVADMTNLPYGDNEFDGVIDVFSSYCVNEQDFKKVLQETSRVLKAGGKFFIYTPGKNSKAWTDFSPAIKIDNSTLNGIFRKDSPYSPSPYPFRFISGDELGKVCSDHGLSVTYIETVIRSYGSGKETFEFIVAEAVKVSA